MLNQTIAQLIAHLQTLPQDAIVVMQGEDGEVYGLHPDIPTFVDRLQADGRPVVVLDFFGQQLGYTCGEYGE